MARLRYVAVVLLAMLALPGFAKARSCPGRELRVMTYNIRLDTAADGANRWALRRDLLLGQVRLIRPAILGLQEVVPGQRADIAAAMAGYDVIGGGRDDGKEAGEAAPLLIDRARLRIIASGMFWLSPTPQLPARGWDAAFPRVASWAHLVDRTSGRRVLAINTHWDHVGVQARLGSAVQLRDWISARRQPGEAVILLGDFNAPLGEGAMQVLLAAQGRFPGLRDSRALSREPATGGPATFNGWDLVPAQGTAIDHILVGPEIAVARHTVLAAHFDGRLASDHFPVIADLLPGAAGTGCAGSSRP